MNLSNRVVTRMPVEELWDENGVLPATRGRRLDRGAVSGLLRDRPVRFVVANVGDRLRWIAPSDRFEFWKREGSLHLADGEEIRPEAFPNGLAYVASEWQVTPDLPVVLLEAQH